MKKSLLVLVMVVVATAMAMAQVTTSALSGKVIDDQGEVVGATIQAVHTPSGTQYGTISNANGTYSIPGMRVGGPYVVKVSYVGYGTQVFEDLYLALGEVLNLNVELKPNADQLEEVVVVGTNSKFKTLKTGASMNINNASLSNMPTVSRSVSDIARLSPYAGASNSFAGGDGRSTNLTIDGANFNNNFGLSTALPGGGNPISLDAIDEIQVVVAPFDVRQTNFIGGGINAITKSGTNQFKGTAYIYYRDQALRGNRINGEDLGARKDEKKTVYGFTLGGPIIKNKLFFFASYETEKNPGQVIKYRAAEKGETPGGMISRCTLEDMNKVANKLKSAYGYNPGSATEFPGDEENHRFMARLDWNIVEGHRLAVRYNSTKNTAWNAPNGNSCDVTPRLNNTYRVGAQSMAFANSMYSMDNNVQTWSLDLNSRFNNEMSNQLLATYSNIEDIRGTNSSEFPHIDFLYDGTTSGGPYMTAGYELFTYNNGVHNKIFTVKDEFKYELGNHSLLAGLSYEHQMANNAFMRNGTGYYRYNNIDDFLNNQLPESFSITYGFNGKKDPNAQVTFNQLGFYLQDNWTVSENLKVNAGIRIDEMIFDESDIMTNKAIKALDFGGKSVDTGKWPNNGLQISPRIGFSWDALGDHSLTLRGGTGLFTGRIPLVFFTNMPTNASLVQTSYTINTKDKNGNPLADDAMINAQALLKKLQNSDGTMKTKTSDMIEALGLPTQITDANHVAGSKISGIDKDFKLPQVWKTSIAADYNFATEFPLSVTGEFIFNKTVNGMFMNNINVKDPAKENMAKFKGADDRYIYENANYIAKSNAVVLENTHKGHGYTANITLNAEPVLGLKLMAAYTHTMQKEVTGMPGSDPISAWQGIYTVNGPNAKELQNSKYTTPNKAIASVNYYIPFTHGKLLRGTTLSLFYEGFNYASGNVAGNSYIYDNDMNGDGVAADLIYIPKDKNEIKFTSNEDRDAFWAFVEQDDYLSKHKGEYAEAYSNYAPWYNQFDFRLAEDFCFKTGKIEHKFQLTFDIQNVGNLLNSHWGVPQTNVCANNGVILHYAGKDADNVPTFSFNKYNGEYIKDSYEPLKNYANCWKLQVGIKYFFF